MTYKFRYFLLLLIGCCCVSFNSEPVRVLMAGDSTMADKVLTKTVKDSVTGNEIEVPFLERGWGMMLPNLLNEKAVVKNYAKNGRSTRTFVEEGLWTELINNARKGDVVIIQFGHNDSSISKGERYTNPTQFRLNFTAFVVEVKAKGAMPVLCTPVARRKFNNEGVLEPSHGEYPEIIRSVAKAQDVPLVDMENITSEWLMREGVEGSKKFFHKFPPSVSPLYPKGLDDNTHFNEAGAKEVALMFAGEVKRLKIKRLNSLMK